MKKIKKIKKSFRKFYSIIEMFQYRTKFQTAIVSGSRFIW